MTIHTAFKGFVVAGITILAGCASQTFAPNAAPEYVVIGKNVPFYAYGPQQSMPPDARLQAQDRIRLLRKEFGFSLVQLADNRTGYVPNEEITVAPPPTPEPVAVEQIPLTVHGSGINLPPVEPALPEPDFGEGPPDAPKTDRRH